MVGGPDGIEASSYRRRSGPWPSVLRENDHGQLCTFDIFCVFCVCLFKATVKACCLSLVTFGESCLDSMFLILDEPTVSMFINK